jgi:hypothetical protein
MSLPAYCQSWEDEMSTHLPLLSHCQIRVLLYWCVGIILTQSCSILAVATALAHLRHQAVNTCRQRLREWYLPAARKRGSHRAHLTVADQFPWLVRWILHLFPPDCRQLAVALDETTLHERFHVLTISVLLRQTAIPVAWAITSGAYDGRGVWQDLFARIMPAVPPGWVVMVCADRGLFSPTLFDQIAAQPGWYPFFRLKHRSQQVYRLRSQPTWRPLATFVAQDGRTCRAAVECHKTNPRFATLVGVWRPATTDPWLILTTCPVELADPAWYAMRSWIEAGFRDLKSDGWHWMRSRMLDPTRAERLWLPCVVALLLTLVAAECEGPHWYHTRPDPKRPVMSHFRRGLITILTIGGGTLARAPHHHLLPPVWLADSRLVASLASPLSPSPSG